MKQGKILYIDEDFASIRYYLQELEDEKFEVDHLRSTDEAFKAINERGDQYQIVILDSAMPSGRQYEKEQTDSGTTTGGFLFTDIRKKQAAVPIIILTNFNGLDWIQKAEATPKVRVL